VTQRISLCDFKDMDVWFSWVAMVLIAQIALGVIIGGVTLALLAMSFLFPRISNPQQVLLQCLIKVMNLETMPLPSTRLKRVFLVNGGTDAA
jgi:hypothetical protein